MGDYIAAFRDGEGAVLWVRIEVEEGTGGQKSFCMSMTRRAEVEGLIGDMVLH